MKCREVQGDNKYENWMEEHGYILQSINWSNVKINWGHRFYTGEDDKTGEILVEAMVLIKRLPLGYTMYYIPRGPVGKTTEDMATLLDYIKKDSKRDKCIFIKFDPYILDNEWEYKDERPSKHKTIDRLILERGCGAIHQGYTMKIAQTVQPRTTMGVYIEDEDFTKKYHRSAKKAIKANCQIELHEEADDEGLENFCKLMQKTEDRKGIQLRDKEYFRRIMQSFKGAKIGLCKTDEGEYASGMLVIEYGKKCEMLYMGNDIELTKKTGSNAYLYDYMFHEARQSGCTYCDISGVEGDLKDGLAMQKSSYGAVVKEYIGEFDIPCKKTLYKLLMPIYRSRK